MKPARNNRNFGLKDFGWRWLVSFILIALTYNPTQFCYTKWAFADTSNLPLKLLVGVALLICYGILIRASLNSLGKTGIFLALLFFGLVIWVLISFNLFDLNGSATIYWIITVVLSLIFALGLCWAGLWRRLTGQYSVSDVDGHVDETME